MTFCKLQLAFLLVMLAIHAGWGDPLPPRRMAASEENRVTRAKMVVRSPSATSGGQVPPSSTSGGQVPPSSTSGGQVPSSSTSGGQVPPSSTSGGQVPPSSTSGGQVPPSSTSGGQVPSSSTSGGQVPPSATSGGQVPPSATSGGQVPPSAASVQGRSSSEKASRTEIIICNLCPLPEEILPCKCVCNNGTSAELTCGPDLLTCTELTDILTMVSFPAPHYIRLRVDGTQLQCKIEAEMWGAALTFEEVHLVNNYFDMVDNHAFFPFHTTLKVLNLEKNALRFVNFPTMSDQPFLETLLLSDNEIDFMPGYSAMELDALRVLMVDRNKLCRLQPNTFAGLPRLELLDLSHNAIPKLEEEALRIPDHAAPHLLVNLSSNSIASIEKNAFSGVQSAWLDLRRNALETLPEVVLRPLVEETRGALHISVDGNPLNCDPDFCWIVKNQTIAKYFDNFLCPNLNKYLNDVKVEDVGGCPSNGKLSGVTTRPS
ncbi:uncharacterized protein LOC122256788 [Penaeus japonicus]|uniref:uncharacterized protein LOC122256788 n=1 Tax=Penaeus japonicus TaxID=27405 RepID=UPI001C716941|nr:uncharacterized protein LOC122256788 [Penaeus japonicus]